MPTSLMPAVSLRSATSVTPAENLKRSLVCCRSPAARHNVCYGSVRGWSPPSPLRKTSWAWGNDVRQPTPHLVDKFVTGSAMLLRAMVWLDFPPKSALLAGLQSRQFELELPVEK